MKILKILILLFFLNGCSKGIVKSKWANEKSPEIFTVQFKTSKGDFEIEVNRKNSPAAVDRFYQLVKHHFFNNGVFFRVVPNFVAQFGSGDSILNNKWDSLKKVPDEEVLQGNMRGSLSYARGEKDSRGTQLFINLKDNFRLDTTNYYGVKGFPTFGKVVKGMNIVDSLYKGYGEKSHRQENLLYTNRKKFFDSFPKIDIIYKVKILKANN